MDEVLADPAASRLEPAERELFAFVDKVNHDSMTITVSDVDAVRAAGWTDEALYDAITVCALFNFYNRWIDATGVHPLTDEQHAMGAKRMAAGYLRSGG